MIVIVFGLPGSGKSYFASQLASMIKAVYINSDRVRMMLPGNKTYSEKEKSFVYNKMLLIMLELMNLHFNLVLDATFYKNDTRRKFIDKAAGREEIIFIEIRADESLIRERLKDNRPDSEADFEVYKKIKKQWEPLYEDHLVLHSTNDNILEMLQEAADYLHVKDDKYSNQ